MKKIILAVTGLLLTFGFMVSCSGKNTENDREDPISIAEETDEEESAREEALKLAEQARLDSIRKDSIEQEAKLNLAQMSFIKNKSWLKTLPKFGFELKNKKVTEDWDEWEGTNRVVDTHYTYQREFNGRIVTFYFTLSKYKEDGTEIGNGYDASMTIHDPAERDAFINDIKKMGKANGIYIYDGMEDNSEPYIWISADGKDINFMGEH